MEKKLLTIGGVAVAVVVLWKLFGDKSKEKTSSFDGEFSYARGRSRGRKPSVAKASGCYQTTQNPYPMVCNGQCISCATNCKDCMAIRKKYGIDKTFNFADDDGHEFMDDNAFFQVGS